MPSLHFGKGGAKVYPTAEQGIKLPGIIGGEFAHVAHIVKSLITPVRY